MKEIINYLLFLSFLLIFIQVSAEVPAEWKEQVDRLIAESSSMKEALDSDSELLKKYTKNINDVIAFIENNVNLRSRVFSCIREKFNSVTQALVQCQTGTEEIIQQGKLQINDLITELQGIKSTTDKKIEALILSKHNLQKEMTSWQKHLSDDLGEYSEEAAESMKVLKDLAYAFDQAAKNREIFTASVDELVSRIGLDTKTELADVYDLKVDLCNNAPSIKEASEYSSVSYSTIECPSQEFIVEAGGLSEKDKNSNNNHEKDNKDKSKDNNKDKNKDK